MKVIPIRHENTVKHDLTVIVASFVIFIRLISGQLFSLSVSSFFVP